MNAVVAPKRRAFTEACAAVQNGCMKYREVTTSLSQVYLCFRPDDRLFAIRLFSQEINRLVLFRGVYLATRKRRIGFVTLLAIWLFWFRLTKSV